MLRLIATLALAAAAAAGEDSRTIDHVLAELDIEATARLECEGSCPDQLAIEVRRLDAVARDLVGMPPASRQIPTNRLAQFPMAVGFEYEAPPGPPARITGRLRLEVATDSCEGQSDTVAYAAKPGETAKLSFGTVAVRCGSAADAKSMLNARQYCRTEREFELESAHAKFIQFVPPDLALYRLTDPDGREVLRCAYPIDRYTQVLRAQRQLVPYVVQP